jgi:biotin carboxyl carrier protein
VSAHLRGRDGATVAIEVRGDRSSCTVDIDGVRREVEILEHDGARLVFLLDGRVHRAHARVAERDVRVVLDGRESVFQRVTPGTATAGTHGGDLHEPVLRAPVPGRILKVNVTAGAAVHAGDVLAVIEAMKMETPIAAPADGTVVAVHVEPGTSVEQDQPVVTCEYGPSGHRDRQAE